MPETIETVRTTFREKREAITALDDALAEERRELKVRAFQGPTYPIQLSLPYWPLCTYQTRQGQIP